MLPHVYCYLKPVDLEMTKCFNRNITVSQTTLWSLQLVLCFVAAVECLPVHHHSADIFRSFRIIGFFFLSNFVSRVLLKPVLGAWPMLHIPLIVMNSLNLTESAFFITWVYSLLPKNLTIQNLFIMFGMLFSDLYVTSNI